STGGSARGTQARLPFLLGVEHPAHGGGELRGQLLHPPAGILQPGRRQHAVVHGCDHRIHTFPRGLLVLHGPQAEQVHARGQRSTAAAGREPVRSSTPCISNASEMVTPSNPSRPRNRSVITGALRVVGSGSRASTITCALITLAAPPRSAGTNPARCRRSNSSRSRATRASERCESTSLAPSPGKCLRQAATPVDCRPSIHARQCSPPWVASPEKER